jgi:hypothetical protein
MSTQSKGLESFLAIVIALFVVDPLRWLMTACTAQRLWQWFLVDYTRTTPTLQAWFGVVALVGILRFPSWKAALRDRDDGDSVWTTMAISFMWLAFGCVAFLAVGLVTASIAGWS